ncbi:MAG: hypothetical protein WAU36_00265 [Cyclobacteriaceae bacterium]
MGFASTTACAQMAKVISQLPPVKLNTLPAPFSTEENLDMLYAMLPPGDSVQFVSESGDSNDYYALNTEGIRFIDLNFDGQLDLLYSGQSGWNNLTDTKVYYNSNDTLKFFTILNGDFLAIDQKENEYEIFTHWSPCCDSYTSRIEKYIFNKTDSGVLNQSISFVGKNHLKGFPEFDSRKATIKDLELFASSEDFKGTSPWFRERNRDARDSLQNGHFISLIKLRGDISVNILDQKITKGITWYLVVTDILASTPKSLYEWSSGKGRRLVGWTNRLNE